MIPERLWVQRDSQMTGNKKHGGGEQSSWLETRRGHSVRMKSIQYELVKAGNGLSTGNQKVSSARSDSRTLSLDAAGCPVGIATISRSRETSPESKAGS